MRIAFLGTPVVAASVLRKLVDAGHDVAVVITRPDKRRSRNAAPEPSPVKAAAQELGLDVSHDLNDITRANVDLAVVVAFGRLIPTALLDQLLFVNIHPSLLPRWRGAAPVQRTILSGDSETGVCVMKLVEAMDEGPIYALKRSYIDSTETADELLSRLIADGADLLVDLLANGLGEPEPQTGNPTHATKLTPEDLHIDWSSSAEEINRVVRIGRAWTMFRDKRLLIEAAEVIESEQKGSPVTPGALEGDTVTTGAGALRLLRVRPEGKPGRSGREWANGARFGSSERLV